MRSAPGSHQAGVQLLLRCCSHPGTPLAPWAAARYWRQRHLARGPAPAAMQGDEQSERACSGVCMCHLAAQQRCGSQCCCLPCCQVPAACLPAYTRSAPYGTLPHLPVLIDTPRKDYSLDGRVVDVAGLRGMEAGLADLGGGNRTRASLRGGGGGLRWSCGAACSTFHTQLRHCPTTLATSPGGRTGCRRASWRRRREGGGAVAAAPAAATPAAARTEQG